MISTFNADIEAEFLQHFLFFCAKNISYDFHSVMIYRMPQQARCFFTVNSAPHFIHFKTYFQGLGEVCVFWVYVCLGGFCFFKTDRVVFGLMFRMREMLRMPLLFGDIFIIKVLVCGLALWFVYFSWKVLLHCLYFRCCLLLGCLLFFMIFSLSQKMHLIALFTMINRLCNDYIFIIPINHFNT